MQLKDHNESPDIHSSSAEYAKRFSGEIGLWMLEVQKEALLDCLGYSNTASVLDVGGGHGQICRPLLEKGYNVTVNVSGESAVGEIGAHKNLKLSYAELTQLPFPDQSFDVVTSFRILPHLENWQDLLAEMCRVSKYGVIFDYPTFRSLNILSSVLFPFKRAVEKNTRTFKIFHDNEITMVLNKYRFQTEKRIPQFLFPMALHRGLKKIAISKILEKLAKSSGITSIAGSPVVILATRK